MATFVSPVAAFLTVTRAFGTAAPVASVIMPLISPAVTDCAKPGFANPKAARISAKLITQNVFMDPTLLFPTHFCQFVPKRSVFVTVQRTLIPHEACVRPKTDIRGHVELCA